MTKPFDIYCRVSRVAGRDKTGDSYGSPAVQEAECRRYAGRQGWAVARVVVEEDVSGGRSIDDRKLGELVERAERGVTGGIVVREVSRFARSVSEGATAIERLRKAGARLADSYGNDSVDNPLAINILLSISQEQLRQRTETWAAVVDRAVGQGKHIARKAPVGYRRRDELAPDGPRDARLTPDPEMAGKIRRGFEMRAAGEPVRSVGALWGVCARHAGLLLRNRVYLGYPAGSDVKHHEPLVDEVLFDAVGKTFTPGTRARRAAPVGVWAGVVRCAACGRRMQEGHGTAGKWSYVCIAKSQGLDCPAPGAALIDLVDEYVFQLVQETGHAVRVGEVYGRRRALWERARDEVAAAAVRLERTIDVTLEMDDRALARRRVREAEDALSEARAELYQLDAPLSDDAEADVAWRSVVAGVTVAKADPKRRRWQDISERVTVTFME